VTRAAPVRHLLVALDGSRLSETSLSVACLLAHTLPARLTLLHVLEVRAPQRVHGEPHLRTAEEARRYLEELATRLRGEGLTVEARVGEAPAAGPHPERSPGSPQKSLRDLWGGLDVAASIAAEASELGADVVVLAAHGWGGLRARILGHVPQQVLVRSTRPVLLGPVPGRFSGHIRTVLVPVDPQGEARAALPWAEEIAAGSGARVHLVTVVPTPATVPPEDAASAVFLPQATGAVLELASEAAREALHQLQASLREQGIQVEAQIRRGEVVHELTAAVADCQPDLVVMATHARGGWDSFWAGSVVARFTPSLTVPVLLVPVGAEDAPRAAERQPSPRA